MEPKIEDTRRPWTMDDHTCYYMPSAMMTFMNHNIFRHFFVWGWGYKLKSKIISFEKLSSGFIIQKNEIRVITPGDGYSFSNIDVTCDTNWQRKKVHKDKNQPTDIPDTNLVSLHVQVFPPTPFVCFPPTRCRSRPLSSGKMNPLSDTHISIPISFQQQWIWRIIPPAAQ